MSIFVRRGVKVGGPYSEEHFQKLIASGKIKSDDLVSKTKDGPFEPYKQDIAGANIDLPEAEKADASDRLYADGPVQWEYMRQMIPLHITGAEADTLLNKLGWDGWELVSISNSTGLLKLDISDSGGGGAMKNITQNAQQLKMAHAQGQNPMLRQTVGVFKRRLTEQRKREILAQASGNE